MKRYVTEGEEVFANHKSDKRLDSGIHEEFSKLNG
jgi:hypothetical protein